MAWRDEETRGALIAAAARRLDENGAAEVPPAFAESLFGRAATEDLALYAPETLAGFARSAYVHLRTPRPPGRHDLRLADVAVVAGGRRRDLTVVQVVNDNMPFLLDSTLAELAEAGHEARFVAHPILAVERDADGGLVRFVGEAVAAAPAGARRESLIQVHLDRIDDEAARARLRDGLDRTYADVRAAVHDWAAMRGRLAQAVHAYRADPPPLPSGEVAEAVAFLDWLAADHFTLLGAREYRFAEGGAAEEAAGPGLGILADPEVKVLRRGRELVTMTPEIRAFLDEPVPLIIAKANVKSRVHRRAHMDYVGVKLFSPEGRLQGELRIVGLFTSAVYAGALEAVPVIRRKVAEVVRRAGFDPASHSGRALLNVLESYPRDELFQLDADTLLGFATDILTLYERPRVRALARIDRFDRFVSVLVFVPKDRYDTQTRLRVGEFLARAYEGRVSAAYPAYPEGPLARTHYIVGRFEGATPRVERAALEEGIEAIVRTWGDALKDALAEAMDGPSARALGRRYADAFNAAYREAFSGAQAIADIAIIERLSDDQPRAVSLERRDAATEGRANLKVFARGRPMPLSERVPLLEHLGFHVVNERTYRVAPAGGTQDERVWLHDMALERTAGGPIDVAALEPRVEAALGALFRSQAESDGLNALVVEAGLGWRDVALVRALSRYLQQARAPFGHDYMAATLVRHAALAARIVRLFHARFDPAPEAEAGRAAAQAAIRAEIEAGLARITSLDEDRILRRFVNLVEAAVRTTYFQLGEDGRPREAIAVKLESARVEGLPKPRPLYEIFVYSPRVEGVHLRFGRVARGGLRWSDRRQDFRTEVLGLVKAQQVKNAVIVPVGAKGGFVPKRLPPAGDRAAWLAEGTQAYQAFVSTLLDLTDNLDAGGIVPPPATVRHDGDDPYLVVAADKGTATFSDTANALSAARGFWLGDAFASGGSQGYDHKAMGITARGAWEAVKRHFREDGVDIQTTPFSVAGIGDMSGDVFGNGMLLSRAIRLVAAFDHRDIFLDPNPDPEASWAERERLYRLPRSAWADYDAGLISRGGGVFSRALKSIPLSPEVRGLLDLDAAEATPETVMNAILKAPVDLLWFGGIGTYVRAAEETDEGVGDRANDAIRVAGSDLRAKVVGEGANLGMTQRGRVEAALRGVRLNTDAIDNSAGVNTSDVEVNIKIALSGPERDGRLGGQARRDLLAGMTDEVAELVLRNNYLQTLALSLAEAEARDELGFHRRLMRTLEAEGRLDRAVEVLPDDAALAARARDGLGLTRPELAVLLAYAKLQLHDALLASRVPDDPYLAKELVRYFPSALREQFPEAIEAHRLRREIVATQLANAIVNRGGPAVVVRTVDRTGADAATIAAAYAAARDAFDLSGLNAEIDALDATVPGTVQNELYGAVQDLLLSRLVWFVRNVDATGEGLEGVVARYRDGVAAVAACLDAALDPETLEGVRRHAAALSQAGAPPALAERIARLDTLAGAADIVWVAERSGQPAPEIAASYFALARRFRLAVLGEAARDIPVADDYDRLALDRALDTIAAAHRALALEVAASGRAGAEGVAAWVAARGEAAGRVARTIEAAAGSGFTLSKLVVAASLLGDLARA